MFKSDEQENKRRNTGMLYNTRNKVIKLFNDYSATAFVDNCLGHMSIT